MVEEYWEMVEEYWEMVSEEEYWEMVSEKRTENRVMIEYGGGALGR